MTSMFSRLMLTSCLLVLALLMLLWQWLEYSHEANVDLVQQSLHRELAEHMVHLNPMLSRGVTSKEALKEAFHDFMLLGPSFEIYTLDPGGRVIAYDAPSEKILSPQVDLVRVQAFLNGQPLPLFGTDPRGSKTEKIFSVSELRDSAGSLTGYLYVILGGESFDHWQASAQALHQQRTWLVNLLIFGLFTLLLLALMLRLLTRPLRRLSGDLASLSQMQLGDRPPQLPGHYAGASEVSVLAGEINQLLTQLARQHQLLKQQQQARQDFLLHLSHDLKTPLTSLLGFIETWRLSPNDSNRDHMIDMAANAGYKLQQLLAQLLELCALENQQLSAHKTRIDLDSYLQEIQQSFVAKARQAKITLEFSGAGAAVNSDPQLLMRILNNLLDNALRYTPAGGRITVSSVWKEGKWQLKVQDTGAGMHQQQLVALCTPQPKAASFEQNSPLPQLGVGLAIVRKLTSILKCSLSIDSRPGEGCSVYLALPFILPPKAIGHRQAVP
ncbi:sensor histidine kinase [Shewanella sp. GXUN23E]|uniref:sensor histidine kinase n=1 Tax=Shewanella sp. GXUN23E TaxID=3422498 RepID=UPI003D7EA75F